MCGICEILSRRKPIPYGWIKSQTDALNHRGPDDEGYLAGNFENIETFSLIGRDSQIDGLDISQFHKPATLLLGHRRLSILDLSSSGHQPLGYEDRNSMRHCIEARVPLADHRHLIEFVFQIPGVYKIHQGWSKSILRQAMKDILPEELRWRKDKLGFPVPESAWLLELQGGIQHYITPDMDEYIQRNRFLRDLSVLVNNPHFEDYNPFVWRVYVLAVWKKVFQV